ncbi:hypothetical protein L596_017511 [Steinernema carpocapsae]|uniref:Uncharacterized protein n=1 Tax=Steinernema carpocapsae TaxID=34508 RepID=A0A4V6XW34_STECR|nr:hypothetical protein L596_017511 [Steinernema carpocapsae]
MCNPSHPLLLSDATKPVILILTITLCYTMNHVPFEFCKGVATRRMLLKHDGCFENINFKLDSPRWNTAFEEFCRKAQIAYLSIRFEFGKVEIFVDCEDDSQIVTLENYRNLHLDSFMYTRLEFTFYGGAVQFGEAKRHEITTILNFLKPHMNFFDVQIGDFSEDYQETPEFRNTVKIVFDSLPTYCHRKIQVRYPSLGYHDFILRTSKDSDLYLVAFDRKSYLPESMGFLEELLLYGRLQTIDMMTPKALFSKEFLEKLIQEKLVKEHRKKLVNFSIKMQCNFTTVEGLFPELQKEKNVVKIKWAKEGKGCITAVLHK